MRRIIADAPHASPRYELVEGDLIVTPSPLPAHQLAVRLLLVALSNFLETNAIGSALCSPSDVAPEPDLIVQPDVYVIPREEAERMARENFPARVLLLAIEVLSPSSARHDRGPKRRAYQRHVPEYWIVDIDGRIVERWRRGEARPEILAETVIWAPHGSAEQFAMDLPSFFERIERGM